jgi:lipoprotein-anchoring transpeptidase ErfK/SrfK
MVQAKPIVTKIVVKLSDQTLTAYENKAEVYKFHCATGDSAHPTPQGKWRIYRKHRKYRSKKYDAQMDYAMFFHGGYAIHMAYLVTAHSFLKSAGFGYFGSHGCVRLSEEDAKNLFEHTPYKTWVHVVG